MKIFNCFHCGATFKRLRPGKGKKFCSKECSIKSIKKQQDKAKNPHLYGTFTCAVCNLQVELRKVVATPLRGQDRHCSARCARISSSNKEKAKAPFRTTYVVTKDNIELIQKLLRDGYSDTDINRLTGVGFGNLRKLRDAQGGSYLI